MNNIKSQGQTSEEDCVNLEGGSFVAGPFFKHFLENIRKQREVGLGFDMEMVRGGAETAEHRQVAGEKALNLPETKDCDLMICFDEEAEIQDPETFFKLLKRRSPGAHAPHDAPEQDAHDPEKEGNRNGSVTDVDQVLCDYPPFRYDPTPEEKEKFHRVWEDCKSMSNDVDFSVLSIGSGLSPTGRRRHGPDLQYLSPLFESRIDFSKLEYDITFLGKHPMIFKAQDLLEDEEEFERMEKSLKDCKRTEELIGWPAPPLLISTTKDFKYPQREVDEFMLRVSKLSAEYEVTTYFGPKSALKNFLYSFMYGARLEDVVGGSGIQEMTLEKAKVLSEPKKVAIIGGHGLGFRKMSELLGDRFGEELRMFEACNFKGLNDLANIARLVKPVRDWEQGKLRRGRGHNKFKRKGKK